MMKYSLLLLLISVVACQQPTSTSFTDSESRSTLSYTLDSTEETTSLTGIVTWTNTPGHAGKITTADGSVYTYNVRAGHTVNGYVPLVGASVSFSADNGASARFVRPVDVNDDDDDDDGDGDGDNPPPPPPPPIW
jgi:hypothetical protein